MKTRKSHKNDREKSKDLNPKRESRTALMNMIIDRFFDENTKLSSCQMRMMVTDFIQLV